MKRTHPVGKGEQGQGGIWADVRTGHANSVTAAGNVPRRSPKTTTPCMLRLGVFRTRHHERTKSRTLENIQTPKNGARYTYVEEMRALGPNALADMPEMIKLVDVTRYAQKTNGA